MIDVTVKVPEERIAEFYAWFGQWLAGGGGEKAAAATAKDGSWSPSDLELAAKYWEKLSIAAKALFSTLIDNPGKKISGEELATKLELPNGKYGVAGVLAWPGRHGNALGRSIPCSRTDGDPKDGDGALYWMEPELADLFRKARQNAGQV